MTNHAICPLCRNRRARRECPAVGQTICAVCCGTKRLVEIRCPSSCPYLTSAREHPPAVVQKRQERDLRFFLPLVADLTEPQHRLLLFFQSVLLKHAGAAAPPPTDYDVAEGVAAVAATLETAGRGVIYEHQPPGIPARRAADEVRRAFAELTKAQGESGRLDRDAALVLRRLEQGARTAAEALAGDGPPAFLHVLGRLMAQAGPAAAPEPEPPRLIIPG